MELKKTKQGVQDLLRLQTSSAPPPVYDSTGWGGLAQGVPVDLHPRTICPFGLLFTIGKGLNFFAYALYPSSCHDI